MRTRDAVRQQLRDELPHLQRRYHVDRLGLCGSFVRDEQTDASDVDLLVTFSQTPDLLTFVEVKQYLEDRLGRRVDLATPKGLRPGPAADNIRREVEYL